VPIGRVNCCKYPKETDRDFRRLSRPEVLPVRKEKKRAWNVAKRSQKEGRKTDGGDRVEVYR